MDKFNGFIEMLKPYLNYIVFGILLFALIILITLYIVYRIKLKKLKELEMKEASRQIVIENEKKAIIEKHKNNSRYRTKEDNHYGS